MKITFKKNVSSFNQDVEEHGSYLYTKNTSFSAIISNKRISDEVERIIRSLQSKILTLIDIGCGDGTYTIELKDRLPELDVTGFDPAIEAIKVTREHSHDCHFFTANILEQTTLPNTKYDIAILRGVLHHLPNQRDAFKNAMLLSDRILIVEPNGNNPILKIIEKYSKYHVDHEEQSFSSNFLVTMCEDLGCSIKRISFVGFVPFFFPSILAKIICFFQPFLERIPLVARYLSAQVVLLVEKRVALSK